MILFWGKHLLLAQSPNVLLTPKSVVKATIVDYRPRYSLEVGPTGWGPLGWGRLLAG